MQEERMGKDKLGEMVLKWNENRRNQSMKLECSFADILFKHAFLSVHPARTLLQLCVEYFHIV